MELGGNVLFFVFGDVDFDKVVDGVMFVKMCNIGEVCIVVNWFIDFGFGIVVVNVGNVNLCVVVCV